MVSKPGYDPNRIDQEWEALTHNEATSPLLNRVTAGLYQPGGAIQTVMLAALLAAHPDLSAEGGYVLNSEAPDAHDPVEVDDLTLSCLPETPDRPLTMAEAYVFGCPQPFVAALDSTLTAESIWERLTMLGMLDAPELVGAETAVGELPELISEATSRERLTAAVVGQGDLTVTPLQMAQVTAIIANQGNMVPLHMVDAVRPPEAEAWQPVPVPTLQPAVLRADVADAVRLTMLQAAALSPYVSQARHAELVLYGHSALAFGKPDASWFVGFVDQTEGADSAALVVVVVVENERDPGVAARVAGEVFAAATADNPEPDPEGSE
jgi:peptidoglycan glycosyltransferase